MVLFLGCLLVVIIIYIWRSAKKKAFITKIKNNPQQSFGTVTKYRGLRYRLKNNIWFYYEYTVDNKRFKNRTKNYHKVYPMENFNYLKNKSFPFIYCANNPSLGCLLITESDFKEFNLVQPEYLRPFNKKLV